MRNILETLTEMNPADSSIMPRLATSWKRIDANTWHFFLRKGVKFHDGKDFNAEAVVFNIKRMYDKRIESVIKLRYFGNVIMEGKALDNHAVELKTDIPQPLLPTLMGTLTPLFAQIPLQTQKIRIPSALVRIIVKWDAGMQIVLERFDGYWGKKPEVTKAIYVWRTESSCERRWY